MADDTKKPLAQGDNLDVESTTQSPETEKSGVAGADDEQAKAEHGNLSEAGGR